MKKLLPISLGLAMLTLSVPISSVYASESEDYVEYDNAANVVNNNGGISLFGLDLNGYEYLKSSTTKIKKTEYSHTHKNGGSGTDNVSYEVEVTRSSTATVSSTASFNAMVTKVDIGTQVGFGKTVTKKMNITWSIPAKSTYELRAGSNWVETRGTENYWSNGKLVESKTVSGKWTYSTWSDKVKK